MNYCRRFVMGLSLVAAVAIVFGADSASAQCNGEPGWYPYTFARGSDRARIAETPLLQRPYRPLHFYGNTIRRSYYRGSALPRVSDARGTVRSIASRPTLSRGGVGGRIRR